VRLFLPSLTRRAPSTSLNPSSTLQPASGAEYITTHPRALPSLARREDTSRKTARALKAERKAAEKLAREEEKKQKKAKKRAEIAKKLELLGVGKGGKEVEWNNLGLDDEFDDAAHEAKMRELFESGNDFIDGEVRDIACCC
jgi:protein KRI1